MILRAIDLGSGGAGTDGAVAATAGFDEFEDESLRVARRRLMERLHARSDDFDATYGLRVIEAALCD